MKSVLAGLLGVFLVGCGGTADPSSTGANAGAVSGAEGEAPAADPDPAPTPPSAAPPPAAIPPPSAPTSPSPADPPSDPSANPSSPPPPPPPAGVTCVSTTTTYPSLGGSASTCNYAGGIATTSTETNVAVTRQTSAPVMLCIASVGVARYVAQGGSKVCLWAGPNGGSAEYVGSVTVSGTTATVAINGTRGSGTCRMIGVTCWGTTSVK